MRVVTSCNPFDAGDVIAERAVSSADEVVHVTRVAAAAQRSWRTRAPGARRDALAAVADHLRAAREELARLICREVGKPITEAEGEVDRAIALADYYAQLALLPDGHSYPSGGSSRTLTARVPRGVVAAVTPWNFPVAIPLWKVLPALAYGNAVVLKPSEHAIGCAIFVVDLLARVLPPDLVQPVIGGADAVDALLDSPDLAAVTFTGSTHVGRTVASRAAALGKQAQCEMGGQNASVVLADAEVELAAATIATASMAFAGQKCTATSRVIVDRRIADRFVVALADQVAGLRIGDPLLRDTIVGPLIDEAARQRASSAIEASRGSVITGGRETGLGARMMLPTLVRCDDREDVLNREEIFGPVATVQIVDGEDEAFDSANATRYGLVASVFTSSLDSALAALDRLEVGLVRINASTTGVDLHMPFGGAKSSSLGPREQGLAAIEFFTETRTMSIAGAR